MIFIEEQAGLFWLCCYCFLASQRQIFCRQIHFSFWPSTYSLIRNISYWHDVCYYYWWYRSFCRSRRWIGRYDCRGPDTKWTNGAGTWCNTVFQHTTCCTFHITCWSIRRLDQWNYYYKVWSSTIHCNTWDDVYCPFPILY